jgi:hypothetical protein
VNPQVQAFDLRSSLAAEPNGKFILGTFSTELLDATSNPETLEQKK